MAKVPSATLKFDTDFDFDSSNAQFIKEALEREEQDKVNMKGWFISPNDHKCTTEFSTDAFLALNFFF